VRLKLNKFLPRSPKPASDSSPRLFVNLEVVEFLRQRSIVSPTQETGGILMGFHEGKNIRVVKASDAGPNARRSSCGFLRDTAYCQAALNEEYALSGADYVGEWHTHVIALRRPSEGDLNTLAGLVIDKDYSFPSFSMILVVVRRGSAEVLGYMATATARTSRMPSVMVSPVNIEQTEPSH
jgi:integrative and conjugative element protein (TIGR02256 family)